MIPLGRLSRFPAGAATSKKMHGLVFVSESHVNVSCFPFKVKIKRANRCEQEAWQNNAVGVLLSSHRSLRRRIPRPWRLVTRRWTWTPLRPPQLHTVTPTWPRLNRRWAHSTQLGCPCSLVSPWLRLCCTVSCNMLPHTPLEKNEDAILKLSSASPRQFLHIGSKMFINGLRTPACNLKDLAPLAWPGLVSTAAGGQNNYSPWREYGFSFFNDVIYFKTGFFVILETVAECFKCLKLSFKRMPTHVHRAGLLYLFWKGGAHCKQ